MTVDVVVKLDFQTDFTRFLASDQINHTVKVVTSEGIIECSGVILAQHSATLQKLVSDDNEIFLDNYTNVKDCLLVLYGGTVSLTLDNIMDIMKFSVQFGIYDMLSPCLQWLENNINRDNFLVILKICNSVSKFAKSYGIDLTENVFQSCKFLMMIYGPQLISTVFQKQNNDIQFAILNLLASLEDGFNHFLPILIDTISVESVSWITDCLNANVSSLVKYSDKHKISSVMMKMESCIDKNEAVSCKFIKLRASLLMQANCSYSCQCLTSGFIPEGNLWIKGNIFRDKLWKKMDDDQIIKLRSLFDDKEHFLYSEIVTEWVTDNKAVLTKDRVKSVIRSIIPYLLNADYIEMLNKKYESLEYNSVVPPSLLANWKRPSHFISSVRSHSHPNSTSWQIALRVSCRNQCPQTSEMLVTLSPESQNSLSLKRSPVKPFHICPEDAREDASAFSAYSAGDKFYFYAMGSNGVHFPMHTDFKSARSLGIPSDMGFIPCSI